MEHLRRSVAAQDGDPQSLLSFYRRMLAFRRQLTPLIKGGFTLIDAGPDHISFERDHDGRRILCAFNLSENDVTVLVPEGEWSVIPGSGFAGSLEAAGIYLPPAQALFAEEKTNDG
jgi:alpha-glucosidase